MAPARPPPDNAAAVSRGREGEEREEGGREAVGESQAVNIMTTFTSALREDASHGAGAPAVAAAAGGVLLHTSKFDIRQKGFKRQKGHQQNMGSGATCSLRCARAAPPSPRKCPVSLLRGTKI